MHLDLDSLREEVFKYLATEGFAVFRSEAGSLDGLPMVTWDTGAHPDYESFVRVAQSAGARIMIFGHRELTAEEIDEAQEQLEDCELDREERRSIERSLSDLRRFIGSTCTLELAFDHQGRMYVFELVTEWFETFVEMSDLLMAASTPDLEDNDDEDESDSSYGGYYSKN